MSMVQEVEDDVRTQDMSELKQGMKEIQKTLHDIDKMVSGHSIKFDNLGNVKELAERTHESAKSAHKRLDDMEEDLKAEIDKVKKKQEQQYLDFKELVETSNKVHTDNYKGIKAFGWKVVFLFITPLCAGFGAFLWFIFRKGLGY